MQQHIDFDSFTSDQKEAVERVAEWYMNSTKQLYKMSGVAGTGKTTVIAHLGPLMKKICGHYPRIAYCAFTGKAAKVMRDKGMDAATIHSTIYEASVHLNEETGFLEHEYRKKDFIDADLIVVDEASTVSKELHDDLCSFRKKILYVGDHAQLPPVGSDINLMDERYLDFKLEKIHRQAEHSDIIRLSMAIRNGDSIAYHNGEETAKVRAIDFNKGDYVYFDQVLCGKNAVRVTLNNQIRSAYRFETTEPCPKSKMIFLYNNKEANVYNGQQFIITSAKKDKDGDYVIEYIDIYDKEAGVQKGMIMGKLINSEKGFQSLQLTKKDLKKRMLFCDHGFAITVHKSQGSEWPSVCLVDDGMFFWDADNRRRFLYTACTRARKKFVWIDGIPT
jgi:exodeoxyribonuclease-5